MERVRKCFLQNATLSDIKEAQILYEVYLQFFNRIRIQPLIYAPGEYTDIAAFTKALYTFLCAENIKVDEQEFFTVFNQLYSESYAAGKQYKQTQLQSLDKHKNQFNNYIMSDKIVGQCTTVDKVFSRAAEVPDPQTIRTQDTLRTQAQLLQKYFDGCKGRIQPPNPQTKALDVDYLHLQTRLRACRYDYTVEKLTDKSYCKILLINIQASVLAGDYREFCTVYPLARQNFEENKVGDVEKLEFLKLLFCMTHGGIEMPPGNQRAVLFVKEFVNNKDIELERLDRYERHLIRELLEGRGI